MNVKIWTRQESDKGGYACMPMKKNIPVGKTSWNPTTCPECGQECWKTPLTKTALSQGAIALCTECAIRKITGK